VRLASANFKQLAPKAAVFCEITLNNGRWAVQVTQGHQFWY